MTDASAFQEQRLSYLRDLYGFCANHINTMFNFYMVAAALVGNAYIQTLNPEWGLLNKVPVTIAGMGLLLSIIFALVHLRSRMMIDGLEDAMKREETTLFPEGGPLTTLRHPAFWRRHVFLFPAAYCLFGISFLAMALYAWGHSPPL